MKRIYEIYPFLVFVFFIIGNSIALKAQIGTDYESNLNAASEFYLNNKEIPDIILMGLVPDNQEEFSIYYGTTWPDHNLGKTDFFEETTIKIFEQVTLKNKDEFYMPSLKLLSFSDGEFAAYFIPYLEEIIEMDKEKFCASITGQAYLDSNPMNYYYELHHCND